MTITRSLGFVAANTLLIVCLKSASTGADLQSQAPAQGDRRKPPQVSQVEPQPLAAVKLAAERGDKITQWNLGKMYLRGEGVSKSDAEAAKWFRRSAEQGYADAQLQLGQMYQLGMGVPRSDLQAMPWIRKAAEQNNPAAQGGLGAFYDFGWGVAPDLTEAVKWYRKAAEQGDSRGQHSLAGMYRAGRGVPKDIVQAVDLWRRSAENGYASAQVELGNIYGGNTEGIRRDDVEAAKWYGKAAEQGDGFAQYQLGMAFADGKGVKQDLAEAYRWLSLAASGRFSPKQFAVDRDRVASRLQSQRPGSAGSPVRQVPTSPAQREANEERLRDAALNGDTALVRTLVEQRVDIDSQDAAGSTALMLAAFYGRLPVVELLLSAGADLSPIDSRGQTALQRADAGCKALAQNVQDRADSRLAQCEQLIARLTRAVTSGIELRLRLQCGTLASLTASSSEPDSRTRMHSAIQLGYKIEDWHATHLAGSLLGDVPNLHARIDKEIIEAACKVGVALRPTPNDALWTGSYVRQSDSERLNRTSGLWQSQSRGTLGRDEALIGGFEVGARARRMFVTIDSITTSADASTVRRASIQLGAALKALQDTIATRHLNISSERGEQLRRMQTTFEASAQSAQDVERLRASMIDWFFGVWQAYER